MSEHPSAAAHPADGGAHRDRSARTTGAGPVVIFVAMDDEAQPILARTQASGTSEVVGSARTYPVRVAGRDALLVATGVGLVNAAAVAAVVASGVRPRALINAGSAGGLGAGVQVGDVVVGASYAYARADVRMFGYAMGQVPGMPATFAADGPLVAAAQAAAGELTVRTGHVVSSDAFIDGPLAEEIRQGFPDALSADMESTALAHVAHLYRLPFVSVRGISDLCGAAEFAEHLDDAADRAAGVVVRLLETLG
ncbi:MAG: 5'-methylthioadenosine/S-adenosylhomocysteine nucleosidase [Micrococcales bacterium]|nr:5'-methylthioadenosine/S-adenosylhomocysteine nucleosidase [Micrococcales bacterium]